MASLCERYTKQPGGGSAIILSTEFAEKIIEKIKRHIFQFYNLKSTGAERRLKHLADIPAPVTAKG
jgi:hypothetical protein